MSKLKILDLFSGIGGFSLGLERTGGFETVAFCEIDPYCRKILAKHWPEVPIFNDILNLRGDEFEPVDVICGGYPCQPFSVAGQRRGKEDDRHLWPEFMRLVAKLRPSWVIGENVAGHVSMGLDAVLSDLENAGYACRTFIIPAVSVDAKHRRDRVWTIGHANSNRQPDVAINDQTSELRAVANAGRRRCDSAGQGKIKQQGGGETQRAGETMANADSQRGNGSPAEHGAGRRAISSGNGNVSNATIKRSQKWEIHAGRAGETTGTVEGKGVERSRDVANANSGDGHWRDCHVQMGGERDQEEIKTNCYASRAEWSPEPCVGRVAYGIPNRVDRIKALGNAVVPQIPEMLGNMILKSMEQVSV